jgi:thioredoxin 1
MAGANVHTFSDKDFNETISKGVSLVDFWAEWCGPCRMQGPIVDQLAGKIGDKVKIGKLNVDENPMTASKYNVMSIPTIIIYKDGQAVKQFVGVQNERTLTEAMASLV